MGELESGRGQVVLLIGEAGIGKTRLLAELRGMAADGTTWLERHCPSYGGELLYWPFAEILRTWLGVRDGERLRLRHGLVQKAALSTLTAARLQELHGRVAAAVEDLFAASLDDYLELIAHHYARSQNFPKALDYLERAGDKAAALDAGAQAAELWRRARKVAVRMGDEAAERRILGRLAAFDAAPA